MNQLKSELANLKRERSAPVRDDGGRAARQARFDEIWENVQAEGDPAAMERLRYRREIEEIRRQYVDQSTSPPAR